MDLIGNSVSIVMTIFLMIAVGFAGTKFKWFDASSRKLFSFLVTRLALPCMVIYNITTNYAREDLLLGARDMIIPLLSMLGSWAIAALLAKLLKIPAKRRGVFLCMCTFSNTVFIGVPINTAIFGESALPLMLLYYIVNTLLFWSIGARSMRKDAGDNPPFFSLATLKSFANPPLIAFVLAVLLLMIGIPVPKPILEACRYMSNIVTPVSMLFIGTVLAGIEFRRLKPDKAQVAVILSRFLLAPALVFLLAWILPIPIPQLTRNVFMMQAIMPVMTQTSIVAEMSGADVEFATVGTTLTTLLSLLVIPLASIALAFLP